MLNYKRYVDVVCATVVVLLIPSIVSAQALPTPSERKAADIASWVTVGAALAIEANHTWDAHCKDTWDQCHDSLYRAGIRMGIVVGGTMLVKHLVHRDRPCAAYNPPCNPSNDSFYSMHTALGFSTLGGSKLAIQLPLAVGTGGLRLAAGQHGWIDVLVGAGVGAAASRIR